MLTLNDINNIETDDEVSQDDYFQSIQNAINSGAWGLQGSYGRAMMDAIESGMCMLGRGSATDYYGNTIPSRKQVQAGTKGSYEYVASHQGTEWADFISMV